MSDVELELDTKIRLNTGIEMPVLGLGTWQLHGALAEKSIIYALRNGYRMIDTARIYQNEDDVGKAIRKSNIDREKIFITTKLYPAEQGYRTTIDACDKSLRLLGIDYIDLYLIHWPVAELLIETWDAMTLLQKKGKCRAIGVSNYMIPHLEYLMAHSSIKPAVNQVEFTPYMYQKDLHVFCKNHQIQLESYSPLTRRVKLEDPGLVLMASKYNKSTAQVLIRWVLQKGLITIPKSSREEKIKENIDVFDFNILPEDMEMLDSFNEYLHVPPGLL
jgi:diketogulonate reductase-like aldo/keto reductase